MISSVLGSMSRSEEPNVLVIDRLAGSNGSGRYDTVLIARRADGRRKREDLQGKDDRSAEVSRLFQVGQWRRSPKLCSPPGLHPSGKEAP